MRKIDCPWRSPIIPLGRVTKQGLVVGVIRTSESWECALAPTASSAPKFDDASVVFFFQDEVDPLDLDDAIRELEQTIADPEFSKSQHLYRGALGRLKDCQHVKFTDAMQMEGNRET